MAKKVLIVEDEVDICRILSLRFQKKGFEVLVANNGEEGFNKAKQEKPDIIILDLMLPKLPGEEVCKKIRSDEEIAETPIIMLTAKATDVDRIVGKVIGANAYLYKPFDAKQLLEEVDKLLEGK
ncbi:MAG: response regulator [Candidatus Omnitrophica bacterium]|nr:response regulator [Candidatus Omnitrophota bacterium]